MLHYNTKLNPGQILMTKVQWEKAVEQAKNQDKTSKPIVKFFNPRGAATWLVSEVYPDDATAFGLCDLGMGEPELGYLSLQELVDVGYIERDLYFAPKKSLQEYADEACLAGSIKA